MKLKAKDLGEDLIKELIFYDKNLSWRKKGIFVRIRKTNGKIYLTYKHHKEAKIDGTTEIEFEVNDLEKAKDFLLRLGLICYRQQEKKRHKFILGMVTIDIDTWPNIPTYLEIEGKTEKDIKKAAQKLDLDYSEALFIDARQIIEKKYGIPVSTYKYFTFDKIG
ncbi:MAG: adenylyl cyclase [Candidatus Levybacteria bacterium CG10_big_fil_rev_8_21_14_0_10_35_13]|nr:MAG: adenylyl cyclase [Candidatus Levybacteria bacterium CG10_big_fil_rev_8_21_14_0_10_35_13]